MKIDIPTKAELKREIKKELIEVWKRIRIAEDKIEILEKENQKLRFEK